MIRCWVWCTTRPWTTTQTSSVSTSNCVWNAFQLPQNMYHKPLPTFLMKLRGDLVLGVFGQTQVVPIPSGALRRLSRAQYFSSLDDGESPLGDMVRIWGCEVNNRAEGTACYGPTPLHIATRSGALESIYCLLSYHADLSLVSLCLALAKLKITTGFCARCNGGKPIPLNIYQAVP